MIFPLKYHLVPSEINKDICDLSLGHTQVVEKAFGFEALALKNVPFSKRITSRQFVSIERY